MRFVCFLPARDGAKGWKVLRQVAEERFEDSRARPKPAHLAADGSRYVTAAWRRLQSWWN